MTPLGFRHYGLSRQAGARDAARAHRKGSDAKFQDVQLHLEFNIEPKSNSGVYLRGRYEVQVLDNPDARMALDTHGCGAVYSRLAPALDATKPAGEWQTLDVEFIGREVESR